jgi:hypothetical protein
MKRPQEWEEKDLEEMIVDQHEENIELDFKRADALGRTDGRKTEISKDVSAFANSAGGTIVYGMDEDPLPPHHAAALSPVDPKEFSKEWLEQVINSRIQPRIEGIVINPIELATSTPGGFAYVVVVPESTTAHQAFDKRYYKRFNFQSVAMEDYEVRQTMNRASRPAYSVDLHVLGQGSRGGLQIHRFQAHIQNESDFVGHEVAAVLFVPQGLIEAADERSYSFEGLSYSRIAGTYAESSQVLRSAVTSAHPLTTYALTFVKSISIEIDRLYSPPYLQVIVQVYDQYGLAVKALFKVSLPGMEVTLVRQIHSSRRSLKSLDL